MARQEQFDTLEDGCEVSRWTLRNASGAGLTVMDLGATILTLEVPDRDGRLADVVTGFDRAADYMTDTAYHGAVIGRFANRIAGGRFALDGRDYELATNNPPNTLHGGQGGFDKRLWQAEAIETSAGEGVRFTLVSPAGDEGFPGEIHVSTTYAWTANNHLIIDYAATSDAPSPFNMTQHSYWNLAGAGSGSVLDHELAIAAAAYLPVDGTMIPTGDIAPVAGTPFDFRTAKPVGRDIEAADEQLARGSGYDHTFVLDGQGLRKVAVLADPQSGRRMTVSTDLPGMQLYTGNFLDPAAIGKQGRRYPARSALALETQFFPDSPNQPHFPRAIIAPDQPFASRTIYAFDVSTG